MKYHLLYIALVITSFCFGQESKKENLSSTDHQNKRGAARSNRCLVVDADKADQLLLNMKNKDSVLKVHTPFGVPKSESKNVVTLVNPTYVTGYDTVHKIAMWVSYRLTPLQKGTKIEKRFDCFRYDPRLPQRVQVSYNDYGQANVDDTIQRGHLKPYADANRDSMDAINTYMMTNMAPQHHTLNETEWLALEQFVRSHSLSKDISEAYIISGSIVDEKSKKLNGKVTIPSAFYKIYYFKKNGQWCYWTFYLNHDWTLQKFDEYKKDLLTKRMTVDDIELKAKTNFFLSPTDDGQVESMLDKTFDLSKLTSYPSFN